MGLIYFVHEWEPRFNESALLSDGGMLAAVEATNKQIIGLAPVLNSETIEDSVQLLSDNKRAVAVMMKKNGGFTYVFAVEMRGDETTTTFTVRGVTRGRTVEVLGEGRMLVARDGVFKDRFKAWDVHIYRISERALD
jgi:hypothetical protein